MLKPTNPGLQNAIQIGFGGILCVCIGIVWVFFGSSDTMFGGAELFALAGMLMIMGAAWKAFAATAGEER